MTFTPPLCFPYNGISVIVLVILSMRIKGTGMSYKLSKARFSLQEECRLGIDM